MEQQTGIGMNRTGVGLSPRDGKSLAEGAIEGGSAPGDESVMAEARESFDRDAEPIGSVPPPATLKGGAKAVAKAIKGESLTIFVDQLGERLAFERSGTRLYEALISKYKSLSSALSGGPTLAELERIRDEEHAHLLLLRDALVEIGGDPTAETPSADVSGVMSHGLIQVVGDPRTTLPQALQAVLAAELVDNDGWSLLISLAERLDQIELAHRFEIAFEDEDRHLSEARRWLNELVLSEGKPLEKG